MTRVGGSAFQQMKIVRVTLTLEHSLDHALYMIMYNKSVTVGEQHKASETRLDPISFAGYLRAVTFSVRLV